MTQHKGEERATIRRLTETDRELFMELSAEFFSSDAVSHVIPDAHHKLAFDHMMSDDRYSHCYIMEYDGEAAGYGLISLTYSREAGGMAVWLEELYIRPEHRGRGLGGQLIDFIFGTYSEAKRFRLEITDGNPAERLYKRKGFKPFPYGQMALDKITETKGHK